MADPINGNVVPIVLGDGTPLFRPGEESTRLQLVQSRTLRSGCVYLRYELHPTQVVNADGPDRPGEVS